MQILRAIITVLYAGTGVAAVVGRRPAMGDLSRGVASAHSNWYVTWTITTEIGIPTPRSMCRVRC